MVPKSVRSCFFEVVELIVEKCCSEICRKAEKYQKRHRPKRIFFIRHGLVSFPCMYDFRPQLNSVSKSV